MMIEVNVPLVLSKLDLALHGQGSVPGFAEDGVKSPERLSDIGLTAFGMAAGYAAGLALRDWKFLGALTRRSDNPYATANLCAGVGGMVGAAVAIIT